MEEELETNYNQNIRTQKGLKEKNRPYKYQAKNFISISQSTQKSRDKEGYLIMPKDKYTREKYFLRYAFNNSALKHIKKNKLNHKGKQIKQACLSLSTGKC